MPSAVSSSGWAITVSARAASPVTIAWTRTLLASSAEIRFQETIRFFSAIAATRVPAAFIQRASSTVLLLSLSNSR